MTRSLIKPDYEWGSKYPGLSHNLLETMMFCGWASDLAHSVDQLMMEIPMTLGTDEAINCIRGIIVEIYDQAQNSINFQRDNRQSGTPQHNREVVVNA